MEEKDRKDALVHVWTKEHGVHVMGDYTIVWNRRSACWYLGKYSVQHRPQGPSGAHGLQLIVNRAGPCRVFDYLNDAKDAVALHILAGSPFPDVR